MTPRDIDDQPPRALEQPLAILVRRHHRAIARQREAQRFGQAVHRVRGEHARARSARRAGLGFHRRNLLVRNAIIARLHHRIDQVELVLLRDAGLLVLPDDLARFHRSARDEHRGNVEPHRRVQHARRDLVAIGDAHHRIRAVRVDHVLDRVRDQVAAGQRVQHAAMSHRDAVIDRDGVELLRDAARRLDLARDQLAHVLEVDVAGHELRERVYDRDDRLGEVAILHAGRAPERAGAGHVAAKGGGA